MTKLGRRLRQLTQGGGTPEPTEWRTGDEVHDPPDPGTTGSGDMAAIGVMMGLGARMILGGGLQCGV